MGTQRHDYIRSASRSRKQQLFNIARNEDKQRLPIHEHNNDSGKKHFPTAYNCQRYAQLPAHRQEREANGARTELLPIHIPTKRHPTLRRRFDICESQARHEDGNAAWSSRYRNRNEKEIENDNSLQTTMCRLFYYIKKKYYLCKTNRWNVSCRG